MQHAIGPPARALSTPYPMWILMMTELTADMETISKCVLAFAAAERQAFRRTRR